MHRGQAVASAVALLCIALAAPLAAADDASLYKRLGGYDAIVAVTDDFIGRMAADPQLGRSSPGTAPSRSRRSASSWSTSSAR